MLYVLGLIAVGMAAYVAVDAARGDVTPPPRRLRLSVRGHRLVVEDFDADTSEYFHFKDADWIAVHTRDGRKRCDWEFGFAVEIAGERVREVVRFREGTRGLDDVIDYILHTPPKGTDLSVYGPAMEAREARVFVLLDRREAGTDS